MPDEQNDRLMVASRPKSLAIHLELMQYPILSKVIREKMRELLFKKGIIKATIFEREVREKAIQSQKRERLDDPFNQESEEIWLERLSKSRDVLTVFYFSMNFKHSEFLKIVSEVLSKKRPSQHNIFLAVNPELSPWRMLFNQGNQIEKFEPKKRKRLQHHLQEIIVVLTKGMLSDQLSFVGIAKRTFSISDLEWIYNHRIGRGKIGGKAGGMMLAKSILYSPNSDNSVDFKEYVDIPASWFLGSDVIYEFVKENNLSDMVQQKYRPFDEIKRDYPKILNVFIKANLPEVYRNQLRELLEEVGNSPIIVRSSSHLEDNFGIAFAGKYDSFFCPNQGSIEENLFELCVAIKKVYASVVSPDALAYRQQMGLIDYDERMAVLIQKVEGEKVGDYFFPFIAGVGFSHNPFQWNPRIVRKDGFLRIVAGLGTRAVDRLGGDYAKMVALSHPLIKPVKTDLEVVQYSQKFMDLINLKENKLETIPISDVINWKIPNLRKIASVYENENLHQIVMTSPQIDKSNYIVTFDGLLKNKRFVTVMKAILQKLEKHYRRPVDIEFTVELSHGKPDDFKINILQCRQQSERTISEEFSIDPDINKRDIVLLSRRMVSTGRVQNIRYVVFVDPEIYSSIKNNSIRIKMARIIGKLNIELQDEQFILVGPGRWGSSNLELGVPVSYADIFNAKALVEIALPHGDVAPEASYGTHFFQDLIESNIYPLPVYPSEKGAIVNYDFFRSCNNCLKRFIPEIRDVEDFIQLIDIKKVTSGRVLEIIMNTHEEKAIMFLK